MVILYEVVYADTGKDGVAEISVVGTFDTVEEMKTYKTENNMEKVELQHQEGIFVEYVHTEIPMVKARSL